MDVKQDEVSEIAMDNTDDPAQDRSSDNKNDFATSTDGRMGIITMPRSELCETLVAFLKTEPTPI